MRHSIAAGLSALVAVLALGCDRDPSAAIKPLASPPRFLVTAALNGFTEDFSLPVLDPSWTVIQPVGGMNFYSLAANPGHLRYGLTTMTHHEGFLNGYSPAYYSCCLHQPGLELHRSFDGEFWLLEAKASYFMPFANGRLLNLRVYFGDGSPGTVFADFSRHRDGPFPFGTPETTPVRLMLEQRTPGETSGYPHRDGLEFAPVAPNPAGEMYYYRLERAGGILTAQWSYDGSTWNTAFSRDMGTLLDGLDQRVVVTGLSWFVPAGSYADWDYINVTPTLLPDLTVDKSHSGNFTFGSNGSYLIRVSNQGTGPTDGTISATDELDPLLDYVSATGTDWSCGAVGSTVTCTRTEPIAEGSYSDILLTVQPNGAGSLDNTASVSGGGESDVTNNQDVDPTTIDAAPTTSAVSVATTSPQYSDQVKLRATVTPHQIEASELTGTVYFYVGAAAVSCTASPPGGSVGSDAIGPADDGVAEILYEVSQASGSYAVTGCFYSSSADFANSGDTESLTVGKENATVVAGAGNGNAYAVSSPGGTASLTLTFVARETNAEPDPNDGARPGDVDNTGVTVQLQAVGSSTNNQTLACVPGASIGTPPAYTDTKTFTCSFGAVAVDAYEVVAQVTGNHYVGGFTDALSVYDPSLGFVSAGGTFTYPGSSDRVSFGLSFIYTGKGKTTPRGNIVVVRHHADGSRCRAKSNGVGAPAISGTTASFSGKANYACLDALGNTLPGGQGNLNLLGYVEDNGEPGIGADKFWVRVFGELMMSKTPSAAANAAVLTGGNVQVPQP